MVGRELEEREVEGEQERQPGVHVSEELDAAHDRGLVLSGS
jgi:hypothetical protein